MPHLQVHNQELIFMIHTFSWSLVFAFGFSSLDTVPLLILLTSLWCFNSTRFSWKEKHNKHLCYHTQIYHAEYFCYHKCLRISRSHREAVSPSWKLIWTINNKAVKLRVKLVKQKVQFQKTKWHSCHNHSDELTLQMKKSCFLGCSFILIFLYCHFTKLQDLAMKWCYFKLNTKSKGAEYTDSKFEYQ